MAVCCSSARRKGGWAATLGGWEPGILCWPRGSHLVCSGKALSPWNVHTRIPVTALLGVNLRTEIFWNPFTCIQTWSFYSLCNVTSHCQMRSLFMHAPAWHRHWCVRDAFVTVKKSKEIHRWLLLHFIDFSPPKCWNPVHWMPSID